MVVAATGIWHAIMTDKPTTPRELLIRALKSQVDMGMNEVVIRKARLAARTSHDPVSAAERILPVVEAFGSQLSTGDHEVSVLTAASGLSFDSLESHHAAICECQLCPLGQTRHKFVYGVGNPSARLLFVGEAPGQEEDLQGEPFVGRAGQLLDRILAAIQLSRRDIYIANILKCRPPGNRDPLPDEVSKCIPYLREQIRIIKPKLLCALGRIAAQNLLATTTPLGKLRGKWHEFEGIPLLVTYHPAALLRFPEYKKETWVDMQTLKARYDSEG